MLFRPGAHEIMEEFTPDPHHTRRRAGKVWFCRWMIVLFPPMVPLIVPGSPEIASFLHFSFLKDLTGLK
jgi:hypothetical protein